jgi:Tol biopolymer transport system component
MYWAGNTLIYDPVVAYPPDVPVTAVLEPGVQALDGRILKKAVVVSFLPRHPSVLYLSPAIGSPALWSLELGGGEPVRLFAPENGVLDYALDVSHSRIVASVSRTGGGADLWLITPDGSASLLLDCSPGSCLSPVWSADGQLIAIVRHEGPVEEAQTPGVISLVDPSSGETGPVFGDAGSRGAEPLFSPDGSCLAYYDSLIGAVRVVQLGGSSVLDIPSQLGDTGVFSPGGEQLIIPDIRAVGRQFYSELWLADLQQTGGLSRLVDDPQEDFAPAWSPDERYVAFARRTLDRAEGEAAQVILLVRESGELRQLTADPSYNHSSVAFDPSGTLLLIQRFRLGGGGAGPELALVDLASSDQTLLVTDAYRGQWLP